MEMLLIYNRHWTGVKKARKTPEITKTPNQNLPAKWDEKKPDFWNLALKRQYWQPCLGIRAFILVTRNQIISVT